MLATSFSLRPLSLISSRVPVTGISFSSRVPETRVSFSSRVPETGVSFSPAGLLSPYHLGAAQQLIKYDVINDNTAVSGSSGGALAAIIVALRMDLDEAMKGTSCYH